MAGAENLKALKLNEQTGSAVKNAVGYSAIAVALTSLVVFYLLKKGVITPEEGMTIEAIVTPIMNGILVISKRILDKYV